MQIFLYTPQQRRSLRAAMLVVCLAGCLGWTTSVRAALGQTFTSSTPAAASGNGATAAAARLNATTTPQPSLYTVHQRTLQSGTVVSEYATPAGLVFAVAWRGPVLPDLDALMGSYFNQFKAQADSSRATRSLGAPLRIDTPDLVVHSSGRMRNFSGHAYAPGLVPTGVNIRDVLP